MEGLEGRQLFALSLTPYSSPPVATFAGAAFVPNTGLTFAGTGLGAGNVLQTATYTGFDLTSGTDRLAIADGFLLTTGRYTSALPVFLGSMGYTASSIIDLDLTGLLGATARDRSFVTFEFTADPGINSIAFDFVFGSNEYFSLNRSRDGFGVFLDGQSVTFDSNAQPFQSNNGNAFTYDNYRHNDSSKTTSNFALGYEGLSDVMRTRAPLDPNVTTHSIKFAIADGTDRYFDAGVFVANLQGSTDVVNAAYTTTAAPAAPGTLDLSAATQTVVNTDGTATITVDRTGGSSGAITVDYATANGTAQAGTHYTDTHGTLSFAAGETTKTISVPLTDLASADASTNFSIAIANVTGGASLGTATTQTITLNNNRSQVELASATYSPISTDGTVTLTVNRTGNTTLTATVDYATADGSGQGAAVAGTNYTTAAGTLSFTAGETSKTFTVPLIAEPSAAASTAFTVALSQPGSATVVGSVDDTTITIANNQSLIAFASSTANVASGGTSVNLTVNRTGNTSAAAMIDYATSNGTALAGTNYTASSATVTFDANETTKTITIPVTDNAAADATADFTVTLSNADGSGVLDTGAASSTVTIANDRSVVSLAASAVSALSSDSSINLTFTRTGNTTLAASVNYATTNGSALAGTHYTATTGTLNFAANETTKTVTVPLTANPATSTTRNFTFAISNPGNATVLGSLTSSPVTVSPIGAVVQFASTTSTAPATGGTVTIDVARTGSLAIATTLAYATADGTASNGTNYTAAAGTLTFAAGESTKSITIPVLDAPTAGGTTTFSLALTSPTGGSLGGQSAHSVTLTNARSVVTFSAPTFNASAASPTSTITVTRTGNIDRAATVAYATANGTATAGSNYTAANGTVEFAIGETSKSIEIPVTVNAAAPASSAFTIALADPNTDTLLGQNATATVTIANTRSQIRFASATYASLDSAGKVTLTLERAGNLSASATVTFFTSDGTATAGNAYIANIGSATFVAGESTKSIAVFLGSKLPVGAVRTFSVNLGTAGGNGVLASPTSAEVSLTGTPLSVIDLGLIAPANNTGGEATPFSNRRIEVVSLTLSENLPSEPDVSQFTLVQKDQERPNGVTRNRVLPITALSYNPTTRVVSVAPTTKLRNGRFYEISAKVPPAASSVPVVNADAENDTPDFSLWFGRGKKLTYIDRDGHRVRVILRGPGVMQLVRSEDGQGDVLSLSGTNENSRLKGRVLRSRFHPEAGGTTTISAIVGLHDNAKNRLADAIQVADADE